MTSPNGLGQSIGNNKAASLGQERLLWTVDLSDQMNLLAVDERFKTFLEVTGLAARDLGCNRARGIPADCVRDADGVFAVPSRR